MTENIILIAACRIVSRTIVRIFPYGHVILNVMSSATSQKRISKTIYKMSQQYVLFNMFNNISTCKLNLPAVDHILLYFFHFCVVLKRFISSNEVYFANTIFCYKVFIFIRKVNRQYNVIIITHLEFFSLPYRCLFLQLFYKNVLPFSCYIQR